MLKNEHGEPCSPEDRGHPLQTTKDCKLDGMSISGRHRLGLPFDIKCASEEQLIFIGKELLKGESIRSLSKQTGINRWSIGRFVELSRLPSPTVKKWGTKPSPNKDLNNEQRKQRRAARISEAKALRALRSWVRSWHRPAPAAHKKPSASLASRVEERLANRRQLIVFRAELTRYQDAHQQESLEIERKRQARAVRDLKSTSKYRRIYEALYRGDKIVVVKPSEMDCDPLRYRSRLSAILQHDSELWKWVMSVAVKGACVVIERLRKREQRDAM